MINKKLTLFLFIIALQSFLYGQSKLAQTGFQFLSVLPDARAASLAGAMTTVENYSGALWNNPAMLAETKQTFDLMIGMNTWIADINHNVLSFSFRPSKGEYGIFGMHFRYVDYGQVEGTLLASNEQGFINTGIIEPYAYSFGLGYARALTDKFTVGGQIRIAGQYLGPVTESFSEDDEMIKQKQMKRSVFVYDFGTYYKTGWESIVFGMSVRNFSEEIKFSQENFQLPLTFTIGASANLMDFLPAFADIEYLLFTLDAVHPRSHPEYIKTGLEVRLLKMFALRAGYMSNIDEANLTFGFGVRKYGFNIDYAYIPYGVFDHVQRFSLRFNL